VLLSFLVPLLPLCFRSECLQIIEKYEKDLQDSFFADLKDLREKGEKSAEKSLLSSFKWWQWKIGYQKVIPLNWWNSRSLLWDTK
jgi:hypothetical protein